MATHTFDDLLRHADHDVKVSRYVTFDDDGEMSVANVAVECETCYEVLLDFDNPSMILSDNNTTEGEQNA
jgi:hypothetical protein